MDPFVAEIRIFPFNFTPKGWAFCDGQVLPISQNTALFSLVGTFYGGDAKVNFALPNLQGASPLSQGQGPGLPDYFPGQTGGSDTVTLITSEMPQHNHPMNASQSDGTERIPTGQLFAGGIGIGQYATPGPLVGLNPSAVTPAGGSQPHNNLMPYLTLNFCIALQGVYPSRT